MDRLLKNNSFKQFDNQNRWNSKGEEFLKDLKKDPSKFIINNPPANKSELEVWSDFIKELGNIKGKKILDIGCGRGEFPIFLAKKGAQVTAIDIGESLIKSAKELARVNNVDCNFLASSATNIDLNSNQFDIVTGLAILHHLDENDVLTCINLIYNLLKPNGFAIFLEPVENSKLFDNLQNLIPIGKRGTNKFRPSILQKKLWKEYLSKLDDRAMTNKELINAGKTNGFNTVKLYPNGFFTRLLRLTGRKYLPFLKSIDRFLFKYFSPIKYLCQNTLVVYKK